MTLLTVVMATCAFQYVVAMGPNVTYTRFSKNCEGGYVCKCNETDTNTSYFNSNNTNNTCSTNCYRRCVPSGHCCDGKVDCPGGDDELNCTHPAFLPDCIRRFYIQVDRIEWDYLPYGFNRQDMSTGFIDSSLTQGPTHPGSKAIKLRYTGYTDDTFTVLVPQEPFHGLVGPLMTCCVGDLVKVTVKNTSNYTVSMHPHGVGYEKGDECILFYDYIQPRTYTHKDWKPRKISRYLVGT